MIELVNSALTSMLLPQLELLFVQQENTLKALNSRI